VFVGNVRRVEYAAAMITRSVFWEVVIVADTLFWIGLIVWLYTTTKINVR